MEWWVIPALIAPLLFSINTFIDTYLTRTVSYKAMPMYMVVVAACASIVYCWLLNWESQIPLKEAGVLIITGIVSAFSVIWYMRILTETATSTVVAFFQLIPMITMLLSQQLSRDYLRTSQLIGFGLVLGTSVLLATILETPSNAKIPWGKIIKAFIGVLIYDLGWSLTETFTDTLMSRLPLLKVLPYEALGYSIGALFLVTLKEFRREALKSLKITPGKRTGIVIIQEVLFATGKAALFLGFSLGPVALVSVFSAMQLIYGICLGAYLTYRMPKTFKEHGNITLKLILAGVLLAEIGILTIA